MYSCIALRAPPETAVWGPWQVSVGRGERKGWRKDADSCPGSPQAVQKANLSLPGMCVGHVGGAEVLGVQLVLLADGVDVERGDADLDVHGIRPGDQALPAARLEATTLGL